ncbi:MAG: hypothetical protein EP341_03095 [Sphingomonadales bacterium]|nr:MAG: hypothetical protein EP341_03095 [Sphingomonadales bacterium]
MAEWMFYKEGAAGIPVSTGAPLPATPRGVKSSGNSSNTALAGDAAFTGSWEVNYYPHFGVNVKADQNGTLTVKFGVLKDGVDPSGTISDSDVVETFSGDTSIYANVSYFRTLVNIPGRAVKVVYTNGSTEQTSFALLTGFGANLFPASGSDDNEILTTVTERERGVFAAVSSGDITADAYRGFIDLSNTTSLPHDRTGRIDLTAAFISVDRDSTAAGSVRIGVVTRIDGTDSDIEYVQGVTFSKSDVRSIIRDRVFSPNQLKCSVVSGALDKVASQFTETGVTAVNTGTSLTDANGNSFNPAVGDLIIKFSRSAGTYASSVSVFYHGERA